MNVYLFFIFEQGFLSNMPKGQPILRRPIKYSKALGSFWVKKTHRQFKKTHKRSKKKLPPRLKIIPPRHIVKDIWARLTTEELVQAKQKQYTITHDQSFRVPSTHASDKTYDVLCDTEGVWTCTCPDFIYRSATNQAHYGFYCKHVADCINKVLATKQLNY